MDISIIGSGYVGLTAGTGLASKDHNVTCVDIDEEKVGKINNGEPPIYEEGLSELLEEVVSEGNLKASTNTIEAVKNSDVTFLSVGTPMQDEGSINLEYVKQAARDAGKALMEKEKYHLFVIKSTVVPKTTEKHIIPILEEETGKKVGEDFGVCMNPEFLREGTALDDFMNPDRIVIGEYDEKSGDVLEDIYSEFDTKILRTSLRAAELIKYASNSVLATKISFINEIGNLCKKLDIDVYEVADGIGLDERVNREFLNSGPGWGGSCFPKDVRALISFMEERNVESDVLESVVDSNEKQKTKIVELLEEEIDISGSHIAVLGLAFKPRTDDVRNSPAIDIIRELKEKNALVKAYDPQAMENMKEIHQSIEYADSASEAMKGAHAALIITHWDEFHDLTMEDLDLMENPLVIEGRKMDYEILEKHTKGISWP